MSQVVDVARRWIGTPYVHQASCRGVGCDCLGLVLGIWRDLDGTVPVVPPYSPDWAETGQSDNLLTKAQTFLTRVPSEDIIPGRIIIFRMVARGAAKHLGIVTETANGGRFVHAYWGRGTIESALSAPWRRRIAAQFEFPGENS